MGFLAFWISVVDFDTFVGYLVFDCLVFMCFVFTHFSVFLVWCIWVFLVGLIVGLMSGFVLLVCVALLDTL